MRIFYTVLILSIGLIKYSFAGIVYQKIGSGITEMYGIVVGDGRNDGKNRIYVANVSNNIYEFEYSSTYNRWTSSTIPLGVPTMDVTVAPARNDNLNRLYLTSHISSKFYEYSYVIDRWVLTHIGTTTATKMYQIVAATGTRDGNWRIYCGANDGVYEFTWTGSTWTVVKIGSVTVDACAWGVCVTNGRNDGVMRVYAVDDKNCIYEYTWDGSKWVREEIPTNVVGEGFFHITAGIGRNDGKVRLYAAHSNGWMYEISWTGTGWKVTSIGLQVSGSFNDPIVGYILPDRLNRVYATNVDGNIYEYTWTGSSFSMCDIGLTTGKFIGVSIGDGRNTNQNRLYGSNADGGVYEFYYDSGPYLISGYIKDENSNPIPGTEVRLSGFSSGVTVTNSSGYYEFINLEGGNFTVTPSSHGWKFIPPSYKYRPLISNLTGQNFIGTRDLIAPDAVTSLTAKGYQMKVELTWIAPGDDRMTGSIINGRYHIKYSTNPLDGWESIDEIFITKDILPGKVELHVFSLPGGNTYYFWLKTSDDAGNWSELSNTATAHVQALPLPIFEDWETGSIDSKKWKTTSGMPTVNTRANNEPSGVYSLELDGEGDEITFHGINLAGYTVGYTHFCWHRGGKGDAPERGEYLRLEILLPTGWKEVFCAEGDGTRDTVFKSTIVVLPKEAFHEKFKFRFRTSNTGWTGDDFYVDNVLLSTMTYSIRGYVRDVAEKGIPGTIITLSGDKSATYIVNETGYYEFPNLYSGNYTVTSSSIGWEFEPSSYTYIPLTSNLINQNFKGVQDLIAPATVTDLTAIGYVMAVKLVWMAPGDDERTGDLPNGRYHIKYSTNHLDGWASVNEISITKDIIPGTIESHTFSLPSGNTYYFWLRTCDNAGNWSDLSNTATAYVPFLTGTLVSKDASATATAYNNARKLVRDSLGNLYLAYTRHYPEAEAEQVFVAVSTDNGKTWQDINPMPIQMTFKCSQFTPSLAIDLNNNLHCVWSEYSPDMKAQQIKYSRYDGKKWSTKINISKIPNYGQLSPAITVDSGNNLHLVWSGKDNTHQLHYQIKYSSYLSARNVWTSYQNIAPITNYSQHSPSIIVDYNDNLHVVWHGQDINSTEFTQIKYSSKTSDSWSNWNNINPGQYNQKFPAIAVDENNKLHVVYQATGPYSIQYTNYTPSTGWSYPENVYSAEHQQLSPTIIIDKNNNPHVLWYGYIDTKECRIKYSSKTTSGWSGMKILSNSMSMYPNTRFQTFFNNSGFLDYVWVYSALGYLYFNRDTSVLYPLKFFIKGGIYDRAGNGVRNITVKLTDENSQTTRTTMTDINGHYKFLNLNPGNYTVTPSSHNWTFNPPNRSYTNLNSYQIAQDFIGTPHGYVAGKVTSTVDGSMLVGTMIEVLKNNTEKYTTTCDINGEYSIQVPTDTYNVRASSFGYMLETKVAIVVYDSTATVNFALEPVGYIAGKVTSVVDGSALVGTVIEVLKDDKVKYTATCDINGDYSIQVVVGTYNVKVSSSGYVSEIKTSIGVTHNSTTTVNFQLRPAGYVAGRVISLFDDSSLAGAIIKILKNGTVVETITCNLNGEYSISIATGTYDVEASSTGFITQTSTNIVVMFRSTTIVDFQLEPVIGYIVGEVTSTLDGSILAGTIIEVLKNEVKIKETTCDRDGKYLITITTGTYDIKASSTGFISQTSEGVIVMFKTTTTVNFQLEPAIGYIAGKITSASDGSTLAGVVIEILKEGIKIKETTCNIYGEYSINIITGIYEVRASSTGFMTQISTGVKVVFKTTTTVNFQLIPVGYIRGKVTSTLDGSVLPGTVIEVLKNEKVKYTTTCDTNGEYFIKVTLGTYNVRASSTGFRSVAEQNINVLHNSTTTLDFALCPENIYYIKGCITEKDLGKGIKAVKIILENTISKEIREIFTDAHGNYGFYNLSSGTYIVTPTKSNWTFQPLSSTVVLITNIGNLNFTGTDLLKKGKIEIPIGIGGKNVIVEIPKPNEAKLIVKERHREPFEPREIINPDKGDEVIILFKPTINPEEYINKEYKIKIFNLIGELVDELTKVPESSADTWVKWSPKDLSSGTYIIHLHGPGIKVFRKIVVAR